MNVRALLGAMLAVLVVATLAIVYLNTQYVADPAAGDATVKWVPPTERVDGTRLEAVSGYRIYYGRDAEQLEHEIAVDREVTEYKIDNLEAGVWYFAVAAISEEGLESAPSPLVQKTIDEPPRSRVAFRWIGFSRTKGNSMFGCAQTVRLEAYKVNFTVAARLRSCSRYFPSNAAR